MTIPRPRILLVGAGRFGREHLREWIHLRNQQEVEFVGVVVRREEARRAVEERYGVPTFAGLDEALSLEIDGIDIVTPPDTHGSLVRRCLAQAHVLVEKPLATELGEAEELAQLASASGHVLMVGHVFRYHPVLLEMKRLVAALPELPRGIRGVMINPSDQAIDRGEANLELLHVFDMVDFLFEREPAIVLGRRRGGLSHVSLRYPGPMSAVVRLGWEGKRKIRTLELEYSDRQITADLIDPAVVVSTRHNQLHKTFFEDAPSPLAKELRAFAGAIRDPSQAVPGGSVGARIVGISLAARPRPQPDQPRIGVIGGGIFGVTCALELARIGQVTLFERGGDVLTETSAWNQRRHHSGFHYPRSYDSIQEIRTSRAAFEAEYGDTILRDFPSYYCTSATGVEIPAERYLAACQSNRLEFEEVDPPDIVAPDTVSLCLKTDEGIYDIARMRELIGRRLSGNPSVELELRTTVLSAVIASDGSKRVTVEGPSGIRELAFDYLVNATYSGRNLVAQWFGFPVEPLRFDLYELLLLRLPIPQIAVTVMDGPFTSLTGTGREGEFFLSHIHDSVSRSVIPDDGMPPTWSGVTSNRENMLRHSSRYLPLLAEASQVRSMWMTRAVNAYARDFDARPTVITDHGFGCWSVLGGKVITSVANAREILEAIRTEMGAASSGVE